MAAEIKRSEVWFDKFRSADPYAASAMAKSNGKQYFTQEDWQGSTVFQVMATAFDFTEVCKVRDLFDDREEDSHVPLLQEVS